MQQMQTVVEQAVGCTGHKQPKLAQRSSAGTTAGTVREPLEALLADTRARCVLLIDADGYAVDAVGWTYGLHIPTLATLIAATYAASAELSRLLGNRSIFNASHHQGPDCNIYTYQVNKDLLLAVVFGSESISGAVWLFAKRTAEALVSLGPEQPSALGVKGDLAAAMVEGLNQLFNGASQEMNSPGSKHGS